MLKKKYIAITFLVFCLTATLFIGVTMGENQDGMPNATNLVTTTGDPSFTTYANISFASPNPYQEVTLFNITGPGKLRYLMMLVYCETYPNNFAGPFKVYIDGKLTMAIGPWVWEESEGQVSVPRVFSELYDTTNYDFEWGVELDSYFEDRLVITYKNTNGRSGDGANCFIMYELVRQPSQVGVGGFYIPADKLSLLAPYIALVSTIILAVSISVAYIKYRKKQ